MMFFEKTLMNERPKANQKEWLEKMKVPEAWPPGFKNSVCVLTEYWEDVIGSLDKSS